MKVSTIRKALLALSLGLGASYMSIAATESSIPPILTATANIQDDGLDPDKTPPVQSLATFLNNMDPNNSQPAEQNTIPLTRLIELHILNLGFL